MAPIARAWRPLIPVVEKRRQREKAIIAVHETLLHKRRDRRSLLEDKIWRSFGILRQARLLTAPEAFLHASLLRLGVGVGLLPVPVPTLNEILIQCQPAHAQLLGRTTDTAASDAWRADMVRGKLRRFAA